MNLTAKLAKTKNCSCSSRMFDAKKGLFIMSGLIACSLAPNLRHKSHYNLRIIQEYFQPKIGRKIKILQPGLQKHYSQKKKKKKKKREYIVRMLSDCIKQVSMIEENSIQLPLK